MALGGFEVLFAAPAEPQQAGGLAVFSDQPADGLNSLPGSGCGASAGWGPGASCHFDLLEAAGTLQEFETRP